MNKETLHQLFINEGFEQVEDSEETYQLSINCKETGDSYPLYIKMAAPTQVNAVFNFEEAYFDEKKTVVPLHVRKSALERVTNLEELILDSSFQSLAEANNSSMAQDFDEVKKLGNEMNNKTIGSEQQQDKLTPDPIQ